VIANRLRERPVPTTRAPGRGLRPIAEADAAE
jgi:hypothetical protein